MQHVDNRIKNIVIVGGGSAGWMTAAALVKMFGDTCSIRLIESEEIGIVGVGEATVPHLKLFNQTLEIDEVEFIKQTQGTFKLGIEFVNWKQIGDKYVHGFGQIGHDYGLLPFHQYWIKAFKQGNASKLDDYSLNTLAALRHKFMTSASDVKEHSPLANIAYAYQFDAALYSKYLRGYAEKRGVRRTEGKVVQTLLREPDGFVDAVVLQSGEKISGELFIDCSGFRGLLIEQALHTGYEDWTHWLPCDRAWATQAESVGPLLPFTRATALEAGWQWRIPLQHRIGAGYVYSSKFISDDEALATFKKNLEGRPYVEPFQLRFVTGKRKKFWNKNVVAIGLSSGFMEPLESTSIFLIQSGIAKLVNLFPRLGFDPSLIERYNRQSHFEFDRIRDFLILHYNTTERNDTPFWDYCRTMEIPDSLKENIRLFRESGMFFRNADEMFALPSWVEVMVGQGIMPDAYHPLVDQMPDKELEELVNGVKRVVANCVEVMPTHQQFIDRYCKAPRPPGML